jgi:hypothetical protein
MKVLIENEGDMDHAIDYAVSLAQGKEKKFLSYHFPTEPFMNIFVQNLVKSYIENKVPLDPKLLIELVCPEGDKKDGNE